MRLTAQGAAARGPWNRALAADPSAPVSVSPAWMDCVCASGRWRDATRAYRTDDGRELVLPLARLSRTTGVMEVAASMPFGWGTGGVLCGDGRLRPEDVLGLSADLTSRRALRTSVRPSPWMEDAWATGVAGGVVRTRHMAQSVELSGGFEVCSSRFERRARRNIRKAERLPIEVEWDSGVRLVEVFDALYRTSVERWARRQNEPPALARWRARRRDPQRKFELVAERLGEGCRIGVARRAGEPAAAIIVLSRGDHATYWRGAMDQAVVGGSGANELLHSMAIEEACRAGRRWYHMGDSAPASSLADFKRRFGAEDKHYTGYRFERPALTATEDMMRRAVKRALRFRD